MASISVTKISHFRPRRVLTFIPGSVLDDKNDPLTQYALQSLNGSISPEFISDSLIFDLEDSVAPDFKNKAINSIGEFLEMLSNKPKIELILRINAIPNTKLLEKEILLAANKMFDSIIIPKLDLLSFVNIFESIKNLTNQIIPIFESTNGIHDKDQILNFVLSNSSSKYKTLDIPAIILGLDDLSSDLRIPRYSFFTEPALCSVLGDFSLCARRFNVHAIGPVYNKFKDHEGLLEETQRLKTIGFGGSLCVYPPYVRDIKKTFTPSKNDVNFAQEVLTKLQTASLSGRGWTFYNDTKYDLADKQYFEWVMQYSELCMKYEQELM